MMHVDEKKPIDGRLRWRCRRGLKELDVLILPFLEQSYSNLSASLQDDFVRLMAEEDVDLLDWLVNGIPVPASYRAIVDAILGRPLSL